MPFIVQTYDRRRFARIIALRRSLDGENLAVTMDAVLHLAMEGNEVGACRVVCQFFF